MPLRHVHRRIAAALFLAQLLHPVSAFTSPETTRQAPLGLHHFQQQALSASSLYARHVILDKGRYGMTPFSFRSEEEVLRVAPSFSFETWIVVRIEPSSLQVTVYDSVDRSSPMHVFELGSVAEDPALLQARGTSFKGLRETRKVSPSEFSSEVWMSTHLFPWIERMGFGIRLTVIPGLEHKHQFLPAGFRQHGIYFIRRPVQAIKHTRTSRAA